MDTLINDVLALRSAGWVRICQVKQYSGDSVAKLAGQMGLKSDHSIYHAVKRNLAEQIIRCLLHKDMAYGSVLMDEHQAAVFSQKLMTHLFHEKAILYTNSDTGDVQHGGGWPATDSTFDAGVIGLNGTCASAIWFQDED